MHNSTLSSVIVACHHQQDLEISEQNKNLPPNKHGKLTLCEQNSSSQNHRQVPSDLVWLRVLVAVTEEDMVESGRVEEYQSLILKRKRSVFVGFEVTRLFASPPHPPRSSSTTSPTNSPISLHRALVPIVRCRTLELAKRDVRLMNSLPRIHDT